MVMEVEGRGRRRSRDRPEALCLLTAHRDQSSSKRSRLVSGLRSCPCGTVPTPSRALAQWSPVGIFGFATVAGAAPASNRLPNYPFGQSTEEHLERCDLIIGARVPAIRKRHRESAKTTGVFRHRLRRTGIRSGAAVFAGPKRTEGTSGRGRPFCAS